MVGFENDSRKMLPRFLGIANAALFRLAQKAELEKPEPLDAPFENFVVWREVFLDLSSINPEKIISKTEYEGRVYILVWDKPEET